VDFDGLSTKDAGRHRMSNHKQPAIFIAGSLGLDFLNTLATPVDELVDWIDDGDGLLAWLEQARLVPPQTLKALKAQAMPGEFDVIAAQARNLREWFRGFVMARRNERLEADELRELEPLNRLLERDERFDQIVAEVARGVTVPRLNSLRRWRSPESLLLPIGAEIAKLICEEDFDYVKACEGSTCTLLFDLHAPVRGPHARARPAMVQHGDLRKSGEASRPSQPTEGVTAGRSPAYQLPVEPAQLFVDCGYPARTNSAVVRSNFVTCESARIECFEDASRQVQRDEPNRDNSDFDCCELLASRRRIP
jgi:predicted RNA-binding Zn ribbon-like protein